MLYNILNVILLAKENWKQSQEQQTKANEQIISFNHIKMRAYRTLTLIVNDNWYSLRGMLIVVYLMIDYLVLMGHKHVHSNVLRSYNF